MIIVLKLQMFQNQNKILDLNINKVVGITIFQDLRMTTTVRKQERPYLLSPLNL